MFLCFVPVVLSPAPSPSCTQTEFVYEKRANGPEARSDALPLSHSSLQSSPDTNVELFDQQRNSSVLVCEPVLFRNHRTKRHKVNQRVSTSEPLHVTGQENSSVEEIQTETSSLFPRADDTLCFIFLMFYFVFMLLGG